MDGKGDAFDHEQDREPRPGRRADLPAAARRALDEAEARRAARGDGSPRAETGGRGGHDPVRYGDWEVGGLASDF